MVLIKNIVLLFATFTSIIALPHAQNPPSVDNISVPELEVHNVRDVSTLEQRVQRPITLQWSPQGRFLLMAGVQLNQGLYNAFFRSDVGLNGLGRVMFRTFNEYLDKQIDFNRLSLATVDFVNRALKGGIMDPSPVSNNGYDIGFAIFERNGVSPTQEVINNLIRIIRSWVEENGGSLTIIQAANGFIDPRQVGADPVTKRGRVATCPAGINLLKYAKRSVSDINPNKDLRWAGHCP